MNEPASALHLASIAQRYTSHLPDAAACSSDVMWDVQKSMDDDNYICLELHKSSVPEDGSAWPCNCHSYTDMLSLHIAA